MPEMVRGDGTVEGMCCDDVREAAEGLRLIGTLPRQVVVVEVDDGVAAHGRNTPKMLPAVRSHVGSSLES